MATIDPKALDAALGCYSEGGCSGLDERERREVVTDIITAYIDAQSLRSQAGVGEAVNGRDIFECANQLGGYIGPTTDDGLARFLRRESDAAAALASEIVRLRAARPAPIEITDAMIERIERAVEIVMEDAEVDYPIWVHKGMHRISWDGAELWRAIKAALQGETK